MFQARIGRVTFVEIRVSLACIFRKPKLAIKSPDTTKGRKEKKEKKTSKRIVQKLTHTTSAPNKQKLSLVGRLDTIHTSEVQLELGGEMCALCSRLYTYRFLLSPSPRLQAFDNSPT